MTARLHTWTTVMNTHQQGDAGSWDRKHDWARHDLNQLGHGGSRGQLGSLLTRICGPLSLWTFINAFFPLTPKQENLWKGISLLWVDFFFKTKWYIAVLECTAYIKKNYVFASLGDLLGCFASCDADPQSILAFSLVTCCDLPHREWLQVNIHHAQSCLRFWPSVTHLSHGSLQTANRWDSS